MQLLNRIRRALNRPMLPPLGADPPGGEFEILGRRCVGTVIDRCNPPFSPLVIEVSTIYREVLLSLEAIRSDDRGRYDFSFEIDAAIDTRDLLNERLVLVARNGFGLESRLSLDGASQLALIREFMGKPHEVIFDLDFTRGGNAEQCVRSGFGGPELNVTCSEGPTARLEVPGSILSTERYELSISGYPFLCPPKLTRQRVTVRLNGCDQEAVLDSRHLDFRSFEYPINSLRGDKQATLELEFPDCFRPIDLGQNKDTRRLAVGFKRMTLVRLLRTD